MFKEVVRLSQCLRYHTPDKLLEDNEARRSDLGPCEASERM